MILATLSKEKSSCYNCNDRRVGCHSKCDRYKKFRDDISTLRNVQRYGHLQEAEILLMGEIRNGLKENTNNGNSKKQSLL